jgi:hypothetical protein
MDETLDIDFEAILVLVGASRDVVLYLGQNLLHIDRRLLVSCWGIFEESKRALEL